MSTISDCWKPLSNSVDGSMIPVCGCWTANDRRGLAGGMGDSQGGQAPNANPFDGAYYSHGERVRGLDPRELRRMRSIKDGPTDNHTDGSKQKRGNLESET
jgi:hypothetical protein